MNYKKQKVMKLSNENQMMFNIVPLFGARQTKIPNSENQRVMVFSCPKVPLPCQPRFIGSLSFTPYSIPGNGFANTFGKGVSNSMSCFLTGW